MFRKDPYRCSRRFTQLAACLRPIVLALACALGISYLSSSFAPLTVSFAQEEKLEDVGAERSANGSAKKSSERRSPTLMQMFWDSGIIGMCICLLSLVAVAFMVEHSLTIRRAKLIPEAVLKELEPLIASGQIDEAIDVCSVAENSSLIADVVLAGLERYKSSEFGFADYKNAVEEAGEDYTSQLYRKTEVLGVIGAIAPMLGLLGTVQGMILAFNTIASKGGMARPDELAGSISLALVTTFEGLVVAIPAMVAFSYFRNRIDSLVAEAGKRVEHIMMPLGRRRMG